jgi:hypothetical protein
VDTQTAEIKSDLLTFEQAAAWLGFTRPDYAAPAEAVRYLCRTRKVRYIRVGKRIMIRVAWLMEFLERESVSPITENTLTAAGQVVE